MKNRFVIIEDLKARLPVIEDSLRASRYADRAGMTEICQHIGNAEQMHRAVSLEIAMADENEISGHWLVISRKKIFRPQANKDSSVICADI